MKSKKGFIFGIVPLLYLILILGLLIALIIFGFKISDGLVAIMSFLTKWWIWILVGIIIIIYKDFIISTLKTILKRIGL